ncbi:MAG: DUF6048 family protein, partial [Prevotella sp.]|nr:DUF6048 family protein [Prevotella sp.]
KHDNYKLFVGLRYGYTSFKYDLTVLEQTGEEYVTAEPEEEDGEEEVTVVPVSEYVEHDGLRAKCHWLEGVFGVDARIFGPLHLGWDIRYRRRLVKKYDNTAAPWYIPGFGNRKLAGFTAMFNLTVSI